MELEFAPLMGPLWLFAAIWGHFPWPHCPYRPARWPPTLASPRRMNQSSGHLRGTWDLFPCPRALDRALNQPPGIIQWNLRSFFHHREPRNGTFPHWDEPPATSFLYEIPSGLRRTRFLLPLERAFERAIPELIPIVAYDLSSFSVNLTTPHHVWWPTPTLALPQHMMQSPSHLRGRWNLFPCSRAFDSTLNQPPGIAQCDLRLFFHHLPTKKCHFDPL